MAGVSVVLFDLDDTLFAHREAARLGFLSHVADLGIADLDAAQERWHLLEELHYPRYLSGELGFEEQRRVRSRAFADEHGQALTTDAAADDWFAGYHARYVESWAAHDDVEPCLTSLAPRRFGIITNGELDNQTRKVARLGLADRIEHIVASAELGVAKPDPAIFRAACDRFGVIPAEACYVGDRLRTDAIGAHEAGLLGVWLTRDDTLTAAERAEAAAHDIPIIASLAELPGLLAR